MDRKLIEFSNLMRRNGVRVSTAELLDAIAAAGLAGLADRESFRAALRATMVKRPGDLPIFEQLFELYFSGLGEIVRQAGEAVRGAMAMSEREFQEFLERMRRLLEEQGGELSELARRLLEDNSGALERMIAEAARELREAGGERSLEEHYFARALAHALGLDRLAGELRELRERLERETPGAMDARFDEYLERRMQALDEIIRRYVRME